MKQILLLALFGLSTFSCTQTPAETVLPGSPVADDDVITACAIEILDSEGPGVIDPELE